MLFIEFFVSDFLEEEIFCQGRRAITHGRKSLFLAELGQKFAVCDAPKGRRNKIQESKIQNDLIMKQQQIKSMNDLRKIGLYPMFYRITDRICGLEGEINTQQIDNETEPHNSKHINKNFLKFHLDLSFFKISITVIFELLDLMHAESSEAGNLV